MAFASMCLARSGLFIYLLPIHVSPLVLGLRSGLEKIHVILTEEKLITHVQNINIRAFTEETEV